MANIFILIIPQVLGHKLNTKQWHTVAFLRAFTGLVICVLNESFEVIRLIL